MTHALVFRQAVPSRATIRDPRPGCPGTLEAVGRFWGPSLPSLDWLQGTRVLYRCAACGALIGVQGDERVSFVRRARSTA